MAYFYMIKGAILGLKCVTINWMIIVVGSIQNFGGPWSHCLLFR